MVLAESLTNETWLDPRERKTTQGDDQPLLLHVDKSGARGRLSAAAARWFLNRDVTRIRFVISRSGSFFAIEAHPTGATIRVRGRNAQASVRTSPLPPGAVYELEPVSDRLVSMCLAEAVQ